MEFVKLDYPLLPMEAVNFCCEKYLFNWLNCFDKSDQEFILCGTVLLETEYSTIVKARSVSNSESQKAVKINFLPDFLHWSLWDEMQMTSLHWIFTTKF